MKQDISDILEKLHTTTGKPRLEIEGAGRPSVESEFLKWIKYPAKGEKAVYVLQDWYEDTSYVTEYRTECVVIPKSGVEEVINLALAMDDKKAILKVDASHIRHFERWDDYSGDHTGEPAKHTEVSVYLGLALEPEPAITLRYDF